MTATTGNTQPLFIGVPFSKTVILTTQVVNRQGGGGTPVLAITAGENGGLIETIYAIPLGDEAANVLRVFRQTGASFQLIREVSIPATSGSSNTAAQPVTAVTLPAILFPTSASGIRLEPNQSIFVALGTAAGGAGFSVNIQGGDY